MIAGLLILLVCGWAGYGIFRLIGPGHIQGKEPERMFACLATGVLLIGWLALLMAELGLFSAVATLSIGVLVGTAGLFVGWQRKARVEGENAVFQRWEWGFLALLLILTGILYFRPHEFIFGGADAGVYVNLGANIARTGKWLLHLPDLAAIPQDAYPMFFREHPPYLVPRYNYLPGFYVPDSGAQTIIPQFFPLHPVWLAIANGIGGVWANLYMTPIWGILGVLAFYFAVREAFEPRLAAVAAALLALTPTQVWFARYPTSEVLTQFLLFCGLWAFARYARWGERWTAVLAGIALGEVMLARIDTYFLLGILPLYAAYLRLRRQLDRRFWWFAGPMLLMGAHSLAHAILQGWPYFYNVYLAGRRLTLTSVTILAGGCVLLAAVFVILDRRLRYPDGAAWLERIWRLLLPIAAVGLLALAVYAYFWRPLQADPTRAAPYWYGGNTIPDVEPYNMVRLGWYLSRPGLALAVLGLFVIVLKEINARTWMMVGVGIFFSVLFVYRTFNNPHHVYVMRRYVPAVIPTLALGMAYAALLPLKWQTFGRVLAAGLVVALAGLMVYKGQVMIPQVDYEGGLEQFRIFTSLIPRDAVVLFNDDEPVGAAGIFGTPLAFLEGCTVLDLREDRLDLNRLDTLVKHWQASGKPVVVVNGSSPVSGLCDRWHCQTIGEFEFELRVLEYSYDHWPMQIVLMQPKLVIYLVLTLL